MPCRSAASARRSPLPHQNAPPYFRRPAAEIWRRFCIPPITPSAPTRFNSTPLCASFAPCVSFILCASFPLYVVRPLRVVLSAAPPATRPTTPPHIARYTPRTSRPTAPLLVIRSATPGIHSRPQTEPPLPPLRNRPRAARPILPPKRKSPPHGGLFASFRRYSMSFSALLYCSQHRFRTTTR